MPIRHLSAVAESSGRLRSLAVVAGIALAAALAVAGRPPLLVAFLLAILVALPAVARSWSAPVALALGLALLPVQLGVVGADLTSGLRSPPEWDFGAFWLHARLAVEGVDFYDTEKVRAVASALGASPSFLEQGRFWNPPASMLLFLPLGLFEQPRAAFLFWSLAQLGGAVASIALLWRAYARRSGAAGLLSTAAIVVSFSATATTLRLGQTHFWVLALILLWLRDSTRFRGGVWLGLAILLKPIAVLFALEPLVRRKARPLAGIATCLLLLSVVAVAAFGYAVTAGYVERGAGPVPHAIYRMVENQSLLGLFARHGWARGGSSPLTSPIYLVAAIAATAWLGWRLLRRPDSRVRDEVALLAAVALILYPQTLDHYAVLLLPAIFVLREAADAVSAAAAASTVLLVALVYQSAAVPLVLAASVLCSLALARGGDALSRPNSPPARAD